MADNNIPGALMLDIQGQKLSMEERQLLSRQAVGGVILFSRNFSEPSQLRDLIRKSANASRRFCWRLIRRADESNASGQVFRGCRHRTGFLSSSIKARKRLSAWLTLVDG